MMPMLYIRLAFGIFDHCIRCEHSFSMTEVLLDALSDSWSRHRARERSQVFMV
jgi:hypothetical protein